MSGSHIGTVLLAARRSAGYSQAEVAEAMGSGPAAISRVETGRAAPSADFIERYALAIRRTIVIAFGKRADVTRDRRVQILRRVYGGSFRERGGRYFPPTADLILRRKVEAHPHDLYIEMLARAERGVDEGVHFYGPYQRAGLKWETIDLRGPVAVAAMFYDLIDWRDVTVPPELALLDRKARRRARRVVSSMVPMDPTPDRTCLP